MQEGASSVRGIFSFLSVLISIIKRIFMKKMIKKTENHRSVVYQTKNGAIELKQDSREDTVWASQAHIAEIFEIERSVISKHIRNIFKNKELDANSVCAKMARTAEDGKTYQVQFYNFDIILAVGYRTSSRKAIAFLQWATKILREHITQGYTHRNLKNEFRAYRAWGSRGIRAPGFMLFFAQLTLGLKY